MVLELHGALIHVVDDFLSCKGGDVDVPVFIQSPGSTPLGVIAAADIF